MSTVTVREGLMRIFGCEGVDHIFGLPGSSEIQFMDGLEDHPEIKYILGLHESTVASMAVGYARASGKIGVLNLHTFVGLGAAMAALLDARRAGVPLLVTAGQMDTRTTAQEAGMAADLVSLGNNFAKWSAEVSSADDLALIMRRAFKVALQPPTGPVFVSIPQNLLAESMEFTYEPNLPSSFSTKRPDRESIERVAERLLGAQKPLVLVGATVLPDAIPEVIKLVEITGAYAFITGMSDVGFPVNHPQFMGTFTPGGAGMKALLDSADATVSLGAAFPFEKDNVIQIDSDPWQIGKNWPVAAGIEGDIGLSVAELNLAIEAKSSDETRLTACTRAENIAAEKGAQEVILKDEDEKTMDNIPISAPRLAMEIANACQPGTIIVDESWSYSNIMQRYIRFPEKKSYFRGRGVSIGQGIPISIGINLAIPDRPVVALVGDGSAIWSCQSLWTAAHYGLPIKFVIIANSSYRLLKVNKIRQMGAGTGGRFLGMGLGSPDIDFCQLAQAVGVRSHRVERPDELGKALASTFAIDGPALLEVAVDDAL
ncbi:MAG: thiamine pyrophosphate-binding protein [Dehalococcoidales bacterium]|jgi:benzoylformate decarboxylase|nr:thiamine pyrophosphate-binding protein [Dehalococcoidales bacterium]